MLIIEGTDMVGKTTLCKALVKKMNGMGFPHVYRWFSKLPDCWDYYHDYLPNIAEHVVQDRFHMSEVAYRLARHEMPRLDAETYRLIDAKIRLVGGFTVVITAPDSFLKGQWEKLAEREMHTLDQIIEVNHFFQENAKGLKGCHKPDIDFHYHMNGLYPGEDTKFMEMVCGMYLLRLNRLAALRARRPDGRTQL